MMKSGVSIIWFICVAAELAIHEHSSYFKINTVCSVSLWASESCQGAPFAIIIIQYEVK